jgi:hypothetical protein
MMAERQAYTFPRSNAGITNPNFSIHGGSRNLSGSGIWGNVDPKKYFTDPHNGYLFSKGSYGMRSELGTATFVNIESFKKFMPRITGLPLPQNQLTVKPICGPNTISVPMANWAAVRSLLNTSTR